jgi:hypothetical protein
VLGQDEQEFVVKVNGLINAGPEFVADFHVFGSIPATHACGLEIGIKSFCKLEYEIKHEWYSKGCRTRDLT